MVAVNGVVAVKVLLGPLELLVVADGELPMVVNLARIAGDCQLVLYLSRFSKE